MHKILSVATLLLAATAASAAAPTQVKALMIAAIDDPKGEISTNYDGPLADRFRQEINSPEARFTLNIRRLKKFKQEGCARLLVTFRSPDGVAKDGSHKPFELPIEMNLCRNGLPPAGET